MKLRYYLRGLGIGMLVAALVLILSGNTGGKMSDEAVKNRAAELGMVEKDNTVLGNLGNEASAAQSEDTEQDTETEDAAAVPEGEEDETAGDEDAAPQEEAAEVSDGEGENAETEPADMEPADAEPADAETEAGGAVKEEPEPEDEIIQRASEVADRAKEVAENSIPEKVITFEVYKGDTSVSVARRAKEMGLVESAADFDVFLCRNGYDKRISIGSYEITVGATEKEIADIVTKTR